MKFPRKWLGALGRPGGQQQFAVLVMKAPAGFREDLRGECRQIIEGRVRQELSLPLIAELAAVYLLPDSQYDIRTGHTPDARRAPMLAGGLGAQGSPVRPGMGCPPAW